MHPPHLPNPSCSISLRRLFQRLSLILLSIFFGLIGGLVGGAMAIGWIWPDYGGGNYWLVSQIDRSNQKLQLQEFIKKETSQKIISVYSGGQKSGEINFLNIDNKLGEAAMVGSDGWAAMYLSEERKFNTYASWLAVNSEGRIYRVEKALYDKFTKIVYFKIRGLVKQGDTEIKEEQFKVIGFSENEKFGSPVAVYENNLWRLANLADERALTTKPHLDAVPLRVWSLNISDIPVGTLVLNDQGRLVGLINESGQMLKSVYITRVLPGVLNKQQIIYPTLSVEGWYSGEQTFVFDNEKIRGF